MTSMLISRIAEEAHKLEPKIVENLSQFVDIPSVKGTPEETKPFGEQVDRALNFILSLGAEMGFQTQNFDGYFGLIDWGDAGETLGVLSHVDVVPPGDLDAWLTPPFQLTVKDGYLCGRGVVDDKGPLLSALFGAYALKRIGFLPQKKLRFIVGTDEESSWGCIDHYKKLFPPPDQSFSPDGMFTVVNREKGILGATFTATLTSVQVEKIEGGEARNLVPASAKAEIDCKLISRLQIDKLESFGIRVDLLDGKVTLLARGKGAPSMAPTKGINAILLLLQAMLDVGLLSSTDPLIFKSLLKIFGGEHNGKSSGIFCSDLLSGDLTMNLGKLEYKDNKLSIVTDCRVPVTHSVSNILSLLKNQLSEIGFNLVDYEIKEPLLISEDSPLIRTLCNIYQAVTNEEPVLHSIGGGTYARAFPNCVCFGSVYPDEKLTVHSPNERVIRSNLVKNTIMYGVAMSGLLNPEGEVKNE